MSASECPYAILGINLDATEDDVVKAHRRLILTHHPDKTDDPTATTTSMRLNDAKERALRIIAERKEQRQTEIDLDTHVLTLKQYIMQTVFEPIPIAADLQTKIRATVADCKGRAGRRSGPNPEIDAYYLYVKNLIGRIRMEEDESQNKMNKSNQRIADLQARLDAETAARERAEKALAERETTIHTLMNQIEKSRQDAAGIEDFTTGLTRIDATITLLQATLLRHEEILLKASRLVLVQDTYASYPPQQHASENQQFTKPTDKNIVEHKGKQDHMPESNPRPLKRKHTKLLTPDQTKNYTTLVENFIQNHLEVSERDSISSQSIRDAFEQIEGQLSSGNLFFKILKQIIDSKLFASNGVRSVTRPWKGYRGLKFK